MRVLELTADMARRADRLDRRRLALRSFSLREAARLRACRERLVA